MNTYYVSSYEKIKLMLLPPTNYARIALEIAMHDISIHFDGNIILLDTRCIIINNIIYYITDLVIYYLTTVLVWWLKWIDIGRYIMST